MSDPGDLGSCFPRRWIPGAIPPPAIMQIYINWLLQELDSHIEQKYPILKFIKGHRRMEVIEYLEAMPDWTAGVSDTKMES